ncbi:ROK family protein [Citrobacter farmeri]|uniref:Transcriptional regulator n=1 Tax=Citrobacter amalonaticus Y19 TaxID=1261127 RepID=A0A0F6RHJ1_CITAM|nr:ROK family protein [Citrobacter amalonaticus]AKE61185.1 transcriptional regulator [Citrobacter amalonaticus Y19]EKV5656841.1 ROK family protein [Citrobacter farmeri]
MLSMGLDIGGTKTEAVILDTTGKALITQRISTVKTDYRAFLTSLVDFIQTLRNDYMDPVSIGLCLPGTEDAGTRLIKNSNIVVLNQQPLIRDLERALQQSVAWDNDANCFTLSESIDGAGAQADIVFGAILGTGCGGGLSMKKTLWRGRNGNAGEWGHNPLPHYDAQRDGAAVKCYCGQLNCTESFISGTGLARQFNQRNQYPVDAQGVFTHIAQGDPTAKSLFRLFRDQLARSFASVINIYDPEIIVVGGGLSRVPAIFNELTDEVSQYIFNTSCSTPIVPAMHGDSSGVRGAAWLGRDMHRAALTGNRTLF